MSPERLVDELWGETPPPTARESLRNHVHALRRLLGPEVLERGPSGYVLHVEAGELDLDVFERLVAEARRGRAARAGREAATALALCGVQALVEFPTEPFAQLRDREALTRQRLTTLEDSVSTPSLDLG